MSSAIFSEQNSNTIQTRRTPTRIDDSGVNSQRQKNHRSLSGKFRNLFRKNSASPNRNSTNERIPSPPPITRQQSRSPEPIRTSTETPLLRAPIVEWPFGKKKPRSPSESNIKTKSKISRKSKKKSLPTTEPTAPIRTDEYQTSIHGQTFLPRTPELTHDGTGRIQSSLNYETTKTRGFRDFTTIDNSKPIQQVNTSYIDITSPPSYSTDLRRSPILNHQSIHYANVEYPYRHDTSVPSSPNRTISNLEIIPGATAQRQVNSTIQNLANSTPTLPQIAVYPSSGSFTTNSNQWNITSTSSLDNHEGYSTVPASVEVDVPKLHAPVISLGHKTSKTESNGTYHASTNLNKFDRPYSSTYSSLSDTDNVSHDKSISADKTYPWLSAIVQHHIRPNSTTYNNHPWILSTNSYQPNRFDASTTTFRRYDLQETKTPLDGYIRPLTPSKSPVQPDVSIIHIDPLDDLRPTSRTSHTTSSDLPITYRTSATIYTREKQPFNNGGEIRTWSIRDNDNMNTNKKSSTSIFIERTPNDHQVVPLKVSVDSSSKSKGLGQELSNYIDQKTTHSTGYEYERRPPQQYFYDTRYYSSSHYSDSTTDDRTYTRSPIGIERDNHYDRSNHFYKDTDQTQESLNTMIPAKNSDLALRHYTLKRSDSYHGLGIVISSDAETRLNHRIRDVEPSSPGCRIGLRKNDRIVNINGVNVEHIEFPDVLVLIKDGIAKNSLQFSVINEAVLI